MLMQPACQDEESVQGSGIAVDGSRYALSGGEPDSINGTYGTGCRDRAGAWSVAFAQDAVLDHPVLSVAVNDLDCQLTVTGVRTILGLLEAVPTIPLSTSFQPAPSVFGTPMDFYANAKLSSDLFAADFMLTLRYSDDPALVSDQNVAVPIPPTVIATSPLNEALDVTIAIRPTATFSVSMDPATITSLTFTLYQGLTSIDASISYDEATSVATLTPWAALELGLLYQATITTGAKDIGDTPLAEDFTWSFTTALCSQAPLDLGTAVDFAVLAASTVTNTGDTVITGDLGVSPGSAATGFPPGVISGTFHLADSTAATAKADLSDAYAEAQARSVCPIALTGDVGGQTLTPGLYHADTSLAVSSGDLTLDALGEVDAVFVFQIGSTLIVDSDRRLILINGANSANIFWQVGSSATLGALCDFAGTIMADQSITIVAGATLNGRALAVGGAVTLDSNTVGEVAP